MKENELSDELQAWLNKRDEALHVKARIREDGGHMMLRSDSYDPEVLDEPLRSEALEFFRCKNLPSN
ncbi:MAG: hypothetical protein PF482_14525 [Desulfobacteraceae bacterium]|jgi:hypothetical protein|nr:hypothetical protein [Desulfobacteraceae bacterium]